MVPGTAGWAAARQLQVAGEGCNHAEGAEPQDADLWHVTVRGSPPSGLHGLQPFSSDA